MSIQFVTPAVRFVPASGRRPPTRRQIEHMKLLSLVLCSTSLVACTNDDEPEVIAAEQALAQAFCQAKPLTAFNTPGDEGRLVFAPDGKRAMWHRESADYGVEIVESRLVGGNWTAPQRVSFASPYTEFDPFIALDGRTVFYTSFRPTSGTEQRPDGDIWMTRLTAGAWSTPIHLGPGVNTDANELFPSQTADGTLMWNSDRTDGVGAWDLWHARNVASGSAELLPGAVNTDIWEFNPSPTPFGNLLAFASLDPDPAAPYSDVFFSLRLRGEYTRGINAGPCVNTVLEEYHPTIDWARGRLIFVRRNLVTNGDFYEVSLPAALLALR